MPIQIKNREFLKDTIYKKKLHIKNRDFEEIRRILNVYQKENRIFPNCMFND